MRDIRPLPLRHGRPVASVTDICSAARAASRRLAMLTDGTKDAALLAIADALEARTAEILEANARDLEAGREAGLADALLDRLLLDGSGSPRSPRRCATSPRCPTRSARSSTASGCPTASTSPRRACRSGVVAVVYEARPNVTIDAAALCLKSGNAIVLRGSSSAAHSNAVLAAIAAEHAPEGAIGLVAGGGREELAELATQDELVDLIIPRGGEGLKKALTEVATVPVIFAASGNCHVYVDASADLDIAREIIVNAKTQRPGVCNAAETLLVHARRRRHVPARRAAPRCATRASSCAATSARARWTARRHGCRRDADWDTEFLALIARRRRRRLRRGGRSTTSTATAPATPRRSSPATTAAARAFELGVDAACVYVNASTRFTDGGEFGFGAEIGNSTQKLHARGPIGLRELCTFKYVVRGRRARPRLIRWRSLAVTASASSAGRSTRRTSAHLLVAPGGLRPARAGPGPAGAGRNAAAQGGRRRPGAGRPAGALPAGRRGRRPPRGVRPRGPARRGVLHGRYAARTACHVPGSRPDVHRRRRHGLQPPDVA